MTKRLPDLDLNEAFGFATILAAFDAIDRVFVRDVRDLDFDQVAFFAYFVLFRLKMYIDDTNYNFKSDGISSISMAIASWMFFLFSAAAMGTSFYIAIQWFTLALLTSTLWVLYAWNKDRSDHRKYIRYVAMNTLHVSILTYALIKYWNGIIVVDFLDRVLLVVLISLVVVDWYDSARAGAGQSE